MPYILSPLIEVGSAGMWGEGPAYEKKNIYQIEPNKMPPVNYDEHVFRPHSLTHIETPAHTQKNGHSLDFYYKNGLNHFFGEALVLKLTGNKYISKNNGIYHWIISLDEIHERLKALKIEKLPNKILISTVFYPQNKDKYHDPNYVLTLSQEVTDFFVSHTNFNLYGTSWKSSDFNPVGQDRPIHNTLFKKALILENLDLKEVPEGLYFISAFPLRLRVTCGSSFIHSRRNSQNRSVRFLSPSFFPFKLKQKYGVEIKENAGIVIRMEFKLSPIK